ncbi:MAG TPA: FAD-dependent oxidoreductase [Ramlibacter sp.]|nr:FAD-dependent oxidoreductase [Ramlibacter sp.]
MTTDHLHRCDVLVVGSGAAGMSAALTARLEGLDVLLVEKAPVFGGTTARSGGWLWIPGSTQAKNAGVVDSPEAVRDYVLGESDGRLDMRRFNAFLRHGPEAVDFLSAKTVVVFDCAPQYPDYHPDRPGASQGGRTILTRPVRGTDLGSDIARLAPPIPELTVFGMMLGSGKEIWHFLRAFKSLESLAYVMRRLARNALDVLRHGRPMTLTSGNALAARLLKSARDLGVQLWTNAAAKELILRDGRVVGAVVDHEGALVRVEALRGVVLACGGFPHDPVRRARLFSHVDAAGTGHWSPTPETNTGDGHRMAEAIGARFDADLLQPAAWMPVSRTYRRDGSRGVMPHFIDRAKPGVIVITRAGRRFVSEAASYHDFGQAMLQACRGTGETSAWLICDHKALRSYGLGNVAAFPLPIGRHLRSGYLKGGRSAEALAEAIGVEPAVLRETIDRFNRDAARGCDTEFDKGGTAYQRFMGDPRNLPNPCLRPLDQGPWYAVQLRLGDLGTYAGLATDENARVLDRDGRWIEGLYAAGNDAMSAMGGAYPGAGAMLGPALTFGYLAGRDLARQSRTAREATSTSDLLAPTRRGT